MSTKFSTTLCTAIFALTLTQCSGGEAQFTNGRQAVTEGRYGAAIPQLEAYLDAQPKGKNASRAQFFIAKANLGLGKLDAAREAFEATLTRYPTSLEAHKARYKLAVIDMVQGNADAAREAFSKLAANPNGPLAPEAKMMAEFLAK